MASATSKKTELKLTGVARASLEELLLDYEDFLRQRGLCIWDKNSPEALAVRRSTRPTSLTHRTGQRVQTHPTLTELPRPHRRLLPTH